MAELSDAIAIVDRPDSTHGRRRSTAANAVHSTSAGETLASVSRAYYALEGPTGGRRDVDLEKVCHAIRSATPALPERFSDADPLLLRYTPVEVVQDLLPLPDDYSANDVARAWTLTALLNLDGMDLFTARHLCDAEGITTLDELADQSQATLDRILETLVAPPHCRPAALAEQGHGERWRLAARMQ